MTHSQADPVSDDPPVFDDAFRVTLEELVRWRRDVRRFRRDPVGAPLVDHLLDLVQLAPSVGNSQPWRWVRVESLQARGAVRANFADCNASALDAFSGDRAMLYARLKLEGLDVAPVQFAVYCDDATPQGQGLGCRTMPEMRRYSVASMLAIFWLAARAYGLGMGWVSILDPDRLARDLNVPDGWCFVAYLCLGWPAEEHLDPDLERAGWQVRAAESRVVLAR